jgi:HK97 family phage major capsid protein
MPKLQDVEAQLGELRKKMTAADQAVVKARQDFESSDADPMDSGSPQYKAFDEASKNRDQLRVELQKGTEMWARLTGASEGGGGTQPFDDPTDKQHGDELLGRRVQALKNASLGRRIFEGDAYKELREKQVLTGEAAFGAVELGKAYDRDEVKALIGLGNTSAGTANLITPDRLPLVDLVPSRPLRMIDLISKGTTDSKSIEYPVVVARGMAANYVPDPTTAAAIDGTTVTPTLGGLKPETSLEFALRTATVRTLATWIPVHRNMMEDAPFLQSMIDAYLRDELDQRIESDIATGSGTGEVFRGILNTSGIGSQTIGSDSIIDAAHKAMTLIRLQFEEPTAFAIHPTTWQTIRLLRDAAGGDPDTGAYLFGPPSQAGDATLWGKPVIPTTAIPVGTVLAGDFSKAMLWLRTGMRVLASDSHADYFTRNLVAILAEIRAAFGVIKPLAFAKAAA